MDGDFEYRYGAVRAKDARFDGWFVTAVTSTGIYCRPSCPARTPNAENVRFYATAAAAECAGFRACKRCRPDAHPGSPEWDLRSNLVGRAVHLIADGVVDREGVAGLARRLGFTERHLHRQLVAALGAGPLALARAQRAHTARLLLEGTDLPISDVAFAAGFRSLRQFNASMREIFARAPSELRCSATGASARGAGAVQLRLPYRAPCDVAGLLEFFVARAVAGVEEVADGVYYRSLRLPHGAGVVALRSGNDEVQAKFWLDDLRDLGAAIVRCRRLLDLDSDPAPIVDALAGDKLIGAIVQAVPGRRVAGHVDPNELAIRAVLGQQISLAGAATLATRLVAAYGEPLARPVGSVTHLFPSAAALAEADPKRLAMPETRRQTLIGLANALATGHVVLDNGMAADEVEHRLLALPGIGPWTIGYIAMRALGDPDAFMPTDLGVRHALEHLGCDGRPSSASRVARRWRPYRAYATQHLWAHLALQACRESQVVRAPSVLSAQGYT
jgi:AraC family transcriptional regulator, regulatory protein of adaptative response / DNA-3-methyladenine glycosylase II